MSKWDELQEQLKELNQKMDEIQRELAMLRVREESISYVPCNPYLPPHDSTTWQPPIWWSGTWPWYTNGKIYG